MSKERQRRRQLWCWILTLVMIRKRLLAQVCLLLFLLLQSVENEIVRFRCRLSRNSWWWEVVSGNSLCFCFPPIQLYLRYFLNNQALDLDTYTLSTAYTHIFSFPFTHCAAGKQIFPPESHFIWLNTGKEQKWSELVFMHIEGNRCLDRLPAQILYVIIII